MAIITSALFKQLPEDDKQNAFESLLDAYDKLKVDKERFENVILSHFESIKPTTSLPTNQTKPPVNTTSFVREPRNFEPKKMEDTTTNLIIGSSIIKRIYLNDMPQDIHIHSYPGSTTEEKRLLINKYDDTTLKTLTIQDGTNTILRNMSAPIEDLFEQYKLLVNEAHDKFKPEHLYLLEVIPTNYKSGNENYLTKIMEFNTMLHNWLPTLKEYITESSSATVITTYKEILDAKLVQPNYYHDDLHLSSNVGCIHLKHIILRHIIPHSTGLPRIINQQRTYNQQRPYHQNPRHAGIFNTPYRQAPNNMNNGYQQTNYRQAPNYRQTNFGHQQRFPAYNHNHNPESR